MSSDDLKPTDDLNEIEESGKNENDETVESSQLNEGEKEKRNRNKEEKNKGNVWAGIGIGILIYVFAGILAPFTAGISFIIAPFVHIGMIIYYFVKGKNYTAIGMLILIGVALMLVAACFGMMAGI